MSCVCTRNLRNWSRQFWFWYGCLKLALRLAKHGLWYPCLGSW